MAACVNFISDIYLYNNGNKDSRKRPSLLSFFLITKYYPQRLAPQFLQMRQPS